MRAQHIRKQRDRSTTLCTKSSADMDLDFERGSELSKSIGCDTCHIEWRTDPARPGKLLTGQDVRDLREKSKVGT